MAKVPLKSSRDGLLKSLQAARAGKLPWLDKLVTQAGYSDTEKLSRKELAGICGVTVMTVGNWISRGCPVSSAGGRKLSLREVAAWLAARMQEVSQEKKAGPEIDQEYVRLLQEAGQEELAKDAADPHLHGRGVNSYYQELGRKRAAELGKIKIEEARRRLLPKAELEQQFAEAGAALRAKLEKIGRKHGRGVSQELAAAVEETCEELGLKERHE